MADQDLTQVEGAELRLHASGPMSVGAHEHLRLLVQKAHKNSREKVRLDRAEHVDEVSDPVVASAFALVEEDLAQVEEEFARRKVAHEADPTPPATCNEQVTRIEQLAENVREVVRDAAADGVRFFIRKRNDQ